MSERLRITGRGAYGQNLADAFHLDRATFFVSRTLAHSQIAVTEILCSAANNGMSSPIPREEALLVALQLRACTAHDLWLDGKSVKTTALAPGTTCVYDLSQSPMANSISPFHTIHFYLPRNALEAVMENEGSVILDSIPHNPGVGMNDAVVRSLGMSLLPAFERPYEVTTLFVDHVMTATAAYVARLFCGVAPTNRRVGLSSRQEKRAKELLAARLDGVVSIARLARECGLPARAFSAAFRASTGMLPHRWLMEHRIDKARHMLIAGSPVYEVAATCGFAGEDHLTRILARAAFRPAAAKARRDS